MNLDRNPDLARSVSPEWDLPETQWVTWGGTVVAPGLGLATKDTPFAEVARIELSTPRLVWVSVAVLAQVAQLIDAILWQGCGRVDLQRDFGMNGGAVLDLGVPGRILRLVARERAGSPAGPPIIVQAVFAPVQPDHDMRRAAVLR
jgi:hypothetical protein